MYDVFIDLIDDLLKRYTDDEVGKDQKEKYQKMTTEQKIKLLENTIDNFGIDEDIETNIVICFDFGSY